MMDAGKMLQKALATPWALVLLLLLNVVHLSLSVILVVVVEVGSAVECAIGKIMDFIEEENKND